MRRRIYSSFGYFIFHPFEYLKLQNQVLRKLDINEIPMRRCLEDFASDIARQH